MLAALLITHVTLSEFSKRFAPPPVVLAMQLPAEAAGLKRTSHGYYGSTILSSLFGKRTTAYLRCGAKEAAVANYEGEHVTLIKGADVACLFAADAAQDMDAMCPDGTPIKLRKGVTTVLLHEDYLRVRGHEDTVGGGDAAQKLACHIVARK